MAGIVNGQPVDQTASNAAWLAKNGDDTAVGIITLSSPIAASGSSVTNIQREHNSIASFVGKALNSSKNDLPIWNNNDVGTSTDPVKDRADYLTQKFNVSTGHTHDPAIPGSGAPVASTSVASVRLRGYFVQGTDLSAVVGTSTDVSTQMSTKTPSGGVTVKGVVVLAGLNKVILQHATGTNQGDEIVDSLGNEVYGRITNSGATWTLSYYVLLSGTETAYTFSSTNVRWYFQELYNPITDAPVYSELAVIASENTTTDVVDATTTQYGKTILATATPSEVGSTGAAGTANGTVANANHTHKGVHSVSKLSSTQLFGDVTIEAGTNITVTQTGNNLKIDSSGAVGYQEVPAGVRNGINTTFGPLTYTPSDGNSILVFIDDVLVEQPDWSLVGSSIVFGAARIPVAGQSVYVFYLTAGVAATPPVPTGTPHTEYHTVSSGEATAKQFNLASSPADPTLTLVDVIGGGAQQYIIDFTIAGSVFNWSGLGLDGYLMAGDVVRLFYIT